MINETNDNSRASNTIDESNQSSFSTTYETIDFIFSYTGGHLNDHSGIQKKYKSSNTSPIKLRKNNKISIKDYEKLGFLGKGPYSKVYLANKINTNKKVALKVINKDFIENEDKVLNIHIEKAILSMLDHPNIIKFYSSFSDSRHLYLALEYAPNYDLADLIFKHGNNIQY